MKMKKKDFDNIIKQNVINDLRKDCFGYKIKGKVDPYEYYYDNKTFDVFLGEMQTPKYKRFYDAYKDGDGSELEEKPGRYGLTPPKMASVASSSRFCYMALRDGTKAFPGEVVFEYGCPIDGVSGNAPQLDARIGDHIYIEAKCHEIFDSHRVVLKEKYWDLIYGPKNDFGLESLAKNPEMTFEIPLSVFGIQKKRSMFDIKQLICHLLGISCQKTPAKLIYLFFMPISEDEGEQEQIDEVFEELRKEIHCIFLSKPIQMFCEKHQIELLAIAQRDKVIGPLDDAEITCIFNNLCYDTDSK